MPKTTLLLQLLTNEGRLKVHCSRNELTARAVYQKDEPLFNIVKEKYRGMLEIQKSGDKTSSGVIGIDIRTHASPKVGQD